MLLKERFKFNSAKCRKYYKFRDVLLILILSMFLFQIARSQNYPIQVVTEISPPYSVYLADYSSPAYDRLKVNIYVIDNNLVDYRAKLKLIIESQNLTIETDPSQVPPPLLLEGGVPEMLYGSDLDWYFNPDHLIFKGLNKYDFLRTGKLPEGLYRFSFKVVDYNRNTTVSNTGFSLAWLILNDPPVIDMPFKNQKVDIIEPQQIVFQWTPRHTGSPNSAFSVEYDVKLFEIWNENIDMNAVVQSSLPIYENTVTKTRLVYGTSEPLLIPGKKYVFVVQAKDTEGRDLFKNNGYSEAQMFTYGDECKPPLNISAEGTKSGGINVKWTGIAGQTEYELKYRRKNAEDQNWLYETTSDNNVRIYELQYNTIYEYQVKSTCGSVESDYSEVKTVTTPEKKKTVAECGKDANIPKITNTNSISGLVPGAVINCGGFEARITDVKKNMDGSFTGTCLVTIPYLNDAKVPHTFENIKVNELNQVFSGELKSVYNPDSKFLVNIEKGKGKETPVAETGNGNTAEELQVDTTITITGTIDTITMEDKGNIVVKTTDGKTTTITPESGKKILVADTSGEEYIVENGKVTPAKEVMAKSTGVTSNTVKDPDKALAAAPVIYFEPAEDQKYGYDSMKYEALRSTYDQKVIHEKDYVIPWKSIESGMVDYVEARIPKAETYDQSSVGFKTLSGSLAAMPAISDEKKKITLAGKTGGTEETVTAFYIVKDTTGKDHETELGKLNIKTYDKSTLKLIIVPVNSDDYPFDIKQLQNKLNGIYNQAVINWEVTKNEKLKVNWDLDKNGKFKDTGTGILSNYTDEMNKVIEAFKDNFDRDKSAYYLFMVEKPDSGRSGFMPLKRQWGFIFTDKLDKSEENYVHTIAHELGHGPFRLYHTFSTENQYRVTETTNNLMDYGTGTYLNKYQWDYIHDPQAMLGIFQEEDEGASYLDNNIIDAIKSSNMIGLQNTFIDEKWTKKGSQDIALDNSPILPTKIEYTILKNNLNILSTGYRKEAIKNSTDIKVSFYETLTSNEPAVTFQLSGDKYEEFLNYLGINDLIVTGNKVSFIDGETVALISSDLKMPELKLTLSTETKPNTDFIATYQIKCKIKYAGSYTYKNTKNEDVTIPYSTDYSDISDTKTIKSSSTSLDIDFGNEFQGGDLIINWKYGKLTGTKTVLIRGENPSLPVIKTYGSSIGTDNYWFFYDLMHRESSFYQFMNKRIINQTTNERGKYSRIDNKTYSTLTHVSEQVGLPLWGAPKGYGLKQLDEWGNKKCTKLQRWNWQENVKGGIEVIDWKINEMKGSTALNKIKTQIAGKEDLLLFDEFTIGSTTFILANSSLFSDWDVKKTITETNRSFLDANLINMFNGGHIIQEVKEIKETTIDETTSKPVEITKYKIIVNTKAQYLNDVFNTK